jgi:hypothetical protein
LESEMAVFFAVRRFVLCVLSFAFGVGKNREREGNGNSSEGEGRDVGVLGCGETSTQSASTAVFVGVRGGWFGEEDRTITSAELVIVTSGGLKLMTVGSGRVLTSKTSHPNFA